MISWKELKMNVCCPLLLLFVVKREEAEAEEAEEPEEEIIQRDSVYVAIFILFNIVF